MKNYRKLFFIIFLGIFTSAYSQTTQKTEIKQSLNNGSIQDQFEYLYKKSYSYKSTKSIKKVEYQKLKRNVLDSLQTLSKKLNESKSTIDNQNNEINTLKDNLKTTNDNLINITKEKDDILSVGLQVSSYINVDDTGARHKGKNGYCTHIGNELFSWFESTESKSRINFLKLLRAGHSDYFINMDAIIYMETNKLPKQAIKHRFPQQLYASFFCYGAQTIFRGVLSSHGTIISSFNFFTPKRIGVEARFRIFTVKVLPSYII